MSAEPAPQQPESRGTRVWEAEDGILCIEYAPGERVDLELARSTFRRRKACLAASGRKRHRIMIIGSRIMAFDYASYRFSASKEVTDTVTAAALVCNSALERHISSVFVNMFRPSYPIRIFESQDAARRWLSTFADE